LYNAPTLKFYHPVFTHSEAIVLTKHTHTHTHTDKQIDAAENIQCSSLCYNIGNNSFHLLFVVYSKHKHVR